VEPRGGTCDNRYSNAGPPWPRRCGVSSTRWATFAVICEESWEEIAPRTSAEVVKKTSRHAWLSDQPLHRNNVHSRCNLGARHRWGIETGFLVEKHHGYQYEHCFSYDWEAMRGYHYLMRLCHALGKRPDWRRFYDDQSIIESGSLAMTH
jgi:hypothetical protein